MAAISALWRASLQEGAARFAADQATGLEAVDPRHHDVQQDEVRELPTQHIDRPWSIERPDELETGDVECRACQQMYLWIVVDDQDARTLLRRDRRDRYRRDPCDLVVFTRHGARNGVLLACNLVHQ